jgi:predicted secreted hydrolase
MLTACSRAAAPLPEVPWPAPTLAPTLSLPRDAGRHDALTEWWYFTGHLRSATDDHEYGFEFTIFQARRQAAPTGYLAHFAITDVDGQQFSHQARFVQVEGDPPAGFPIDVDGWSLGIDNGADVIQASMSPGPGVAQPLGLDLRLIDDKPAVLHHGGYIEYGPAGGSYYYSRTRIEVTGYLRQGVGDDARTVPVSGLAWMDHQWGNFVVASSGGWDWYSLQLDDRTELMLYVLRGPDGATTGVYGTQVMADGSERDLEPGSVTSLSTSTWTSPHTGAVYPSGWLVTLPDRTHLTVQPSLADQELYFPGVASQTTGVGVMAYWEGAVTITGDRSGVGYVELTGYAGR